MTLYKGYIRKAYLSPDYLLGEVTQPNKSKLSETSNRTTRSLTAQVRLVSDIQPGLVSDGQPRLVSLDWSVTVSLDWSVTVSLVWSVTVSLDWSVTVSLDWSVVVSLDWSVAVSPDWSVVVSIDWSVVISLDWSVTVSLDWSVTVNLPPPVSGYPTSRACQCPRSRAQTDRGYSSRTDRSPGWTHSCSSPNTGRQTVGRDPRWIAGRWGCRTTTAPELRKRKSEHDYKISTVFILLSAHKNKLWWNMLFWWQNGGTSICSLTAYTSIIHQVEAEILI